MIGEQPGQPLARADGIAGEDRPLAGFAQRRDVLDHRVIDILAAGPLGREVARAIDLEIEHRLAFRLVKAGSEVRGRIAQAALPFVGKQVELVGAERAITAGVGRLGAHAVGLIVGDRLEPLLGRRLARTIAQDHRIGGQMVEQRLQPLLEQRQPMLHAGQSSPVADRLIQRVAGRGRAEAFPIAGTEALDAVFVEQGFRRGQQGEAVDAPGRALVGGVEGAHALDLVAEEVEPQPLFGTRGKQIDQPAAHRELAGVMDGIDAVIAIGLEQLRQPVERDALAGCEARDQLTDAERGQRALDRRVDRGQDQARAIGLLLQAVERRQPLRHDPQCRRRAVIGQAVPGRKAQHFQLGREIGRGRLDAAHRRFVGRDEHRPAARRARQVGEQRGLKARRHARQGQRGAGSKDGIELRHGFSSKKPSPPRGEGWERG